MNLRGIPVTAAALRIALDASNGNESAAAWAVWNTAKADQRLRTPLVKELCTADVVQGSPLAECEQKLLKALAGDEEVAT
jgi:hypothetical protein